MPCGPRAPVRRAALATLALAACVLLFAHPAAAAGSDAPNRPWRIVLIRTWDSLYPVNVMRETALREAILEKAPRVVEFFTEEIDPLRFPSAIVPEFIELMRHKYADTPVDLVIASGIEPLQFVAQHRDAIWPGAAIVFNGVYDGALDGWKRPPRTTGVSAMLDIDGAVALGRALVPAAKRLYVVSGSAPFDQYFLSLARPKLDRIEGLDVRYLVGLTREQATERVSELGAQSLVLYLTMLRDAKGQLGPAGASALLEIAKASSVPVISAVHTQFGRGPVGGSSSRYDVHGRIAGQLARRVLEGEDPDAIPLATLPKPICEVDWNRLVQWSIPVGNVPAHCGIVNRPGRAWRDNLWLVAALAVIVLLQAALLWNLAMQSRRRRQAEAELRVRSMEMARVARLSTLGELTASIAHEINQPMGAILSNAEAAEMMLDQGRLDDAKLREILHDIRVEDLRASEVIKSLRKLLSAGEWNLVALEVNTEVAEALRHVTFEAARRGVRLVPDFGTEMPPVFADSVQLQQVVINLVMNAMDAVSGEPESAREVRVHTGPSAGGVEVTLADTGPGVAPENVQKLFQTMFTTRKDGMGFGLSIVKTIVEMHRGRVSHEHNKPRGAVFRVWLPSIGT